jgi:hypothetical protein
MALFSYIVQGSEFFLEIYDTQFAIRSYQKIGVIFLFGLLSNLCLVFSDLIIQKDNPIAILKLLLGFRVRHVHKGVVHLVLCFHIFNLIVQHLEFIREFGNLLGVAINHGFAKFNTLLVPPVNKSFVQSRIHLDFLLLGN